MLNLQSHIEGALQVWKGRLACSAPGCRGRRFWSKIADGSGSILLHERRYCFPACFEHELHRRLNQLRFRPAERPRPPHRVPLGLLMLSRGELNDDQLRRALEAQKQDGKRIGECLQRMGYAEERQITAALGSQWSCPVLRTIPPPTTDCAIPLHLLRRFCMAPVHLNASTRVLHVAFGGDIEYRALLSIEQTLDCKAEPCLAAATAIRNWLQSSEERGRGGDQIFENVRSVEEITRIVSSYATKFCADQARLSSCGEYVWFRIQGGTDAANLVFRQTTLSVGLQL